MRPVSPGWKKTQPGRVLPTLLALASLAVCQSAAAASSPSVDDCPEAQRTLDAVAEPALALSVVDLGTDTVSDVATLDRGDGEPVAVNGAPVPQLYLGPRVETLVRDVFGDMDVESEDTAGIPVSPLADSGDIELEAPTGDREDEASDDGYSPVRLYREMYRTDI